MKTYFTPGPAALYPGVSELAKEAIDSQLVCMSHRSDQFKQLFSDARRELQQLLGCEETAEVFFLGSANEGWERLLQSCVREQSFHFINGSFSKRFYTIATQLQKKSQKVEVALGQGFDLLSVEIPSEVEMICITHNETSSGVMTFLDDIYALKEKHPEKLIVLDVVSSLPYGNFDFTKIDAVLFSVQKGLGLPAGLGGIIVNDKCLQKAEELEKEGRITGTFHSLVSLRDQAAKNFTVETPNILNLFLLKEVCKLMNEKGQETIMKETDEKAQLLYDYFDNHTSLSCFVSEKNWRSPTVVVVNTPNGSAPIIESLHAKGFVVGTGYGKKKDEQIRIGNFPAVSVEDVKRLIEAFQELQVN